MAGWPVSVIPLDLESLRPLSLAEINERATLVTRTCRKYLVPTETVTELFAGAEERFGALSIEGRRSLRYSSTYFDTPDLRTFRDHRQGRRLRFKTRVRTYLDTDTHMFEVKLKERRGITDKVRVPHDALPEQMSPRARTFLEDSLGSYGLRPPDVLVPSAVIDYRRSTVVALTGEERITVDTALVGRRGRWCVGMRPDMALVEIKTRGGLTATERLLHAHGFRKVTFSKYGAVIAALEPHMRGNRWHRTALKCLESPLPLPSGRAPEGRENHRVETSTRPR